MLFDPCKRAVSVSIDDHWLADRNSLFRDLEIRFDSSRIVNAGAFEHFSVAARVQIHNFEFAFPAMPSGASASLEMCWTVESGDRNDRGSELRFQLALPVASAIAFRDLQLERFRFASHLRLILVRIFEVERRAVPRGGLVEILTPLSRALNRLTMSATGAGIRT
jgi:hypothetical protein